MGSYGHRVVSAIIEEGKETSKTMVPTFNLEDMPVSTIIEEGKEAPKTMVPTINFEDMPQLVLEKITSFLNHKQLLTLEQVSRKLKCAVDAHFSVTDHLIIGYLPRVEYIPSAMDKKYLDGLLKIIKRCGIRLRTIQITTQYRLPNAHFEHIFASAAMSDNCPNVENIIAFPKMDIITILTHYMFQQQNVLLNVAYTEIYANRIKLSKGETCKLRSITLESGDEEMEDVCKRVLNLYSNLEQIAVDFNDYDDDEHFIKLLPQFIKKGLKDLHIRGLISIPNTQKYCDIGKDLRTLRVSIIYLQNNDEIVALNKLQLPENLELSIAIENEDDCIAQMSQSVCNSIIECEARLTDCRSMSKLKNLKVLLISTSDQLKLITDEPLPELKRIEMLCEKSNMHDFWMLLPQLLTNKGSQLIFIDINTNLFKSVNVVWKVLRHCNAARIINCDHSIYTFDSHLTVTYEDVKAIFHLPNLQEFTFQIRCQERRGFWRWMRREEKRREENNTCYLFHELVERVAIEHTDFQFKCISYEQDYLFYRINRINF